MQFIALEKLHNMMEGYRQRFRVGQIEVILLRYQGRDYLYSAICPHAQGVLLADKADAGVIYCARHGFEFDLETGQLLRPERVRCAAMSRYQVAYEGHSIGFYLS